MAGARITLDCMDRDGALAGPGNRPSAARQICTGCTVMIGAKGMRSQLHRPLIWTLISWLKQRWASGVAYPFR
jgi:hypothetical protein